MKAADLNLYRADPETFLYSTETYGRDKWPLVIADPIRIKQVLYNLLSNAVKFTPAAGQITVTVRRLHAAQSTVHGAETPEGELSTVHCEQPGEFVEIAVKDTGIGIKSEDLPRLFTSFTQLEPALTKNYEGAGLGLALTKRLVDLHGGTIRVESAGEGKGSTFTVRLPLAGSRDTPRLLVVDDDENLLGTIRGARRGAGYR
ncbi:MAG: hypothetical protein HY278_11235 [candidate division NC10 bacterium]|nr:hypothetical protein [candidate division NC10 bacterium]